MFPTATYTARREQLCKDLGQGLIFFPGNSESPVNYAGNVYPFRQDSNFLYFIGIDQPGLAATLDAATGETVLYGNELGIEDIVWTGPLPTLKELAERVGISKVRPMSELGEALSGLTPHFTPPYRFDTKIWLSELLWIPVREVKNHVSEALIHAIIRQRAYKSPEEVAQIETAVNISRRMHLAAMTHARAGMTEAELMALVARESFAAGCVPAYGIILSVRGEVLHNVSYNNVLQPGQMLLCDAGSESPMHYAGDITRAFPIDATFGTRQKEIYQVVLDTQLEAIHALKPGVSYRDIHHLAALKMTKGLRQLGLMKGDPEEAVQQGAHALFFPHGLGHMLGLDVHDMEDLGEKHVGYGPDFERSTQFGTQYLRLARKLESGFVLTVEPGCYFIPALIDQWQAEGKYESFINYDRLSSYRDFGGVRIEDNYLITDTGARLLGEAIPKTVAEVEVMRQG